MSHLHTYPLRPSALLLCSALLSWMGSSPPCEAADPLRVVSTIPDLADVARQIGGDRVSVTSLAKGTENQHAVSVRPSMMVALNRADLFLEMGLSLESTWLPDLLLAARNRRIEPGGSGFVNVSEGWAAAEVPTTLSRKEGDLHPQGNPHYNLDPTAGRHFTERIRDGLIAADPEGEDLYRQRADAYLARLSDAEDRWRSRARQLAGRKVSVYHLEFNYLLRFNDMELVGAIEPKPGIPPRPSEVAEVIGILRQEKVPVLITAAWSNTRQVADIASKSGARLLELPSQVGGAPWATGWIELIDGLQLRLLEAYGVNAER